MSVSVNIGKVPGGEIRTVVLADDATINDALDAAGIDVNANSEVRMSGMLVEDMETKVIDNSTILISDSRIKNN